MDLMEWMIVGFVVICLAGVGQEAMEHWSENQTEQKAIEAYSQCITEHAPNVSKCGVILEKFGYAEAE